MQHLDVRAHGFLLDVAKTPGVPALGVLVFIFSWMVPHADVIRSARLVIVGRCVPLSPQGPGDSLAGLLPRAPSAPSCALMFIAEICCGE